MNFKYSLAALLLASSASTAMAATTGSQKFTVTVPSNISIVAPPTNVSLTHKETDSNEVFEDQTWTVKGNTLAGVNVTFVAVSPFQHTDTSTTFKRNALLGLAPGTLTGPATWTIVKGSDATDYANATPKNTATVKASSNGVGTAELKLSVTFITDGFGTFAAGTYETTVTGTVASN